MVDCAYSTNVAQAASADTSIWSPEASQLFFWRPVAGLGTGSAVGLSSPVITGSATTRTPATTNYMTQRSRIAFPTAVTAGTVVGIRQNSNANGVFYPSLKWAAVQRIAFETISANMRFFCGMSLVTTPTDVDPNSLVNSVGIGCSAAGNLQLYTNDASGTATQIDLGSGFPVAAAACYQLSVYNDPSGSVVTRVARLDVPGAVDFRTLSADIPVATSALSAQAWLTNHTDAQIDVFGHLGFEGAIAL